MKSCLTGLLIVLLFAQPGFANDLNPRAATGQFREFHHEFKAFNREDPFANAYRAGRYNRYLLGVLDTLQGKTVCFRECVCELDKLVDKHLTEHPELPDRSVVDWLVTLLENTYPCK